MNVRMVIALNMYDELESSGNKLDYIKLSQLIGVPMIPTVCRRGEGIDQLFHVIIGIYEGGDFLSQKGEIRSEILEDLRDWHKTYVPDHEFGSHKEEEDARPRGYMRHIHINHGPELERSIEEVKKAISQNEDIRHKYSTRFLSIKLLENDKEIENFISTLPNGKEIIAIRNKETLRIRKVMNEDSEQAITDAKYGFITGALKETFTDNHFADVEIHWITRKDMVGTLSMDGRIDKIWAFDKETGLAGLLKMAADLRKEHFDYIYDAHSNLSLIHI